MNFATITFPLDFLSRRLGVRRKTVERTIVIPAVTAAHVLFFFLLGWQMKGTLPAEAGFQGQSPMGHAVAVDLVAYDPTMFQTQATPAKPKAAPRASHPAPAKPPVAKVADPVTPTDHDVAPPDLTPVTTDDTSVSDQPVLSDADSQALAQFQPASASAQGNPGAPCNLTPSLVSDFAQNPVVRQGVDELPPSDMSVANAIMMWDGSWPIETQSGGKALLRAMLVRELSASRPDCLQQVNQGPVFFFVPEVHRTVIVAIGSGVWTWGQLLAPAPMDQAAPTLTVSLLK